MEEDPPHNRTDQRHARIMAKLKDAVLARVPANVVVNQQLTSYVQHKLHAFFPHFDSPSHPPYASMIQTAIVKLNEEGGSSEGSISEFIRKEFEDLPWQHEAFLSHHLRKLCRSGEILVTNNERYMIVVKSGDCGDQKEMGRRMNVRRGRKPRKRRFRGGFQRQPKKKVGEQIHLVKQDNAEECWADGREMEVIGELTKAKEGQIQVLENRCEVREQDTEVTDRQIEWQSLELNDEEGNNLHCQQIELLEEPSNLHKLQSKDDALACEQQNEVVLKQNKLQKLQIEVVYEKRKDNPVIETIPNVSETSCQCLDCNGFSLSLEEPCMKLVKKKTEFLEEQLMENSLSLGRMKKRNIVREERKFTVICGRRAQKLSEPIIYGRRRVCKSDPNFFDKHQSPGQAKSPPLSKPVTVTTCWRTCKFNSENDQQHQLPGQAKNLSRCKPDADTIMSDLSPSDPHNEDGQHQPEDHTQVQAQETSMTMRDLLPSQQHNDEQHLPGNRDRGQGRLQKAEGGRDCHDHDVLRVYFRRKRKGLLTYVRHKHKA